MHETLLPSSFIIHASTSVLHTSLSKFFIYTQTHNFYLHKECL
jgi:hypothetical protein